MPDKNEVARIESAFARQYGLDLSGIKKDVTDFQNAIAAAPSTEATATFYTYNGTQAFVPDLETIDASGVVPDQRLSVRQIEANLDEAAKYAQACQQLRAVYGDLARHRNDTRFKGEEFVRLDAVHLEEVDAGLYKLPWQEAADEATGLASALEMAKVQQGIPNAMTSDAGSGEKYASLLSTKGMLDQINWNSEITKNIANTNKDRVNQLALDTTGYKIHMDLATWLETQAQATATMAQLSSKLTIAKRKEEYLRKDEGFKVERAFISRQLAWLQIAEHCRSGSELNYDERLRAIGSIFAENIRPLIERAMIISHGLKEIYGIDLPLGDLPTGGILDQIAPWLVKVSDSLSKFKRTQRLTVVQFGGKVTIAADGKTFETAFTVDASNLPGSNSLLRGVNFEFVGDGRVPISVSVMPPEGVVLGGGTNPLRFGRVCSVAPSLDLRPQHSDLLWNGSPKGIWKVEGGLASNTNSIEHIIMYLWVVST